MLVLSIATAAGRPSSDLSILETYARAGLSGYHRSLLGLARRFGIELPRHLDDWTHPVAGKVIEETRQDR